ncbi:MULTISPECIES: DUF1134 domain-containing protein [Pacificimonas]|uniref:DUF1134 domain-containing protein n=1 Tax=Pacificimonas TaxID=1960290 RepID=UPI001CC95688|nr:MULTISPECIES: DUF1134 domain-containing protein [Pacificimonas]
MSSYGRGFFTLFTALLLSACATSPTPPPPAAEAPAADSADAETPAASTAESGASENGFDEERILREAEQTFGEGAEGLAKLVEDVFRDRGRPNAYIVGNEGSGAVAVGLRYGAGRLYHAVEGNREVYWNGPSIGVDIGGDANKVFALVYNLYDTQDLYQRFPSVEGKVYAVGGFTANYMQRGDVVIVPIRLGAGWRFGANVGYLKFTEDRSLLPF